MLAGGLHRQHSVRVAESDLHACMSRVIGGMTSPRRKVSSATFNPVSCSKMQQTGQNVHGIEQGGVVHEE